MTQYHSKDYPDLDKIIGQINKLMEDCVSSESGQVDYQELLDILLQHFQCEFGFIGEVIEEDDSKYVRVRAISDIAWDQATKELYVPAGMEFRNLDSLFGHVVTTQRPLLTNSPSSHPSSCGLPPGHPPLNSFMGYPLVKNGRTLSIICLANRRGGFDDIVEEIFARLAVPLTFLLDAAQTKTGFETTNLQLESLVEAIDDGIITMKESGEIAALNPGAESIFGYTRDQVYGKPVTVLMPDRFVQAHLKGLANYIKTGKERLIGKGEVEVVAKHREGHEFPISMAIYELKVRGSRYFSAYIRDPLKKEAVLGYERTASELTQLIETANAPIFGIDADGNINVWNFMLARISGMDKTAVIGKPWLQDFIAPESKASVEAVLRDALSGIETSNYELAILTKDKSKVVILLNATTRRDSDGQVTGVISVGQDITEMRKREAAVRQANKIEALGQLTGGVAHDYNNLLTVVRGNIKMLLSQRHAIPESEIEEILEDALSAAEDGAKLSQQLLSYARQQPLVRERVDLNRVVASSERFLQRAMGAGIAIDLKLEPITLPVNTDQSLFENALLNLCLNARDASHNDGVIRIETSRVQFRDGQNLFPDSLPSGQYAKVTVVDSGMGISQANLSRVLDPFFTTKQAGSGLGLSMVHGFALQCEGGLNVVTKEGSGTSVSILLPIKDDTVDAKIVNVSDDSILKVVANSRTVLIVEDDRRVRKYSARCFKRQEFTILEAEDAAAAIEILNDSAAEIDLVFSDIMMPGEMNGRELATQIKDLYPEIRVLLTSGYEDLLNEKKSEPSDIQVLRKPFTEDELLSEVKVLFTDQGIQ